MSIERYSPNIEFVEGFNCSCMVSDNDGEYVMHDDHVEEVNSLREESNRHLKASVQDLKVMANMNADNRRLREALTITRGQWIHSVNSEQCKQALKDTE